MVRIAPSSLSSFFLPRFPRKSHNSKLEKSIRYTISGNNERLKGVGDRRKTNPRMRVMFVRQDPAMFPIARFGCFSFTATNVVKNSGKDVPNAMIVAPIISSDIPRVLAIEDAEETIK